MGGVRASSHPWGRKAAQLTVPQPRGRSPRHETALIWVFWGLFPPHAHPGARREQQQARCSPAARSRGGDSGARAPARPRPPRAAIGRRRTGEWRAALAIGCGREQARGGAQNKEVTCGGGAAAPGRAARSRPGAPGTERAGGVVVVPGRLLALRADPAVVMPSQGLEGWQVGSRGATPL